MVPGRVSMKGPDKGNRNQADNFENHFNIIRPLEAIASAKACSLVQLGLAWLLARGQDIVPIAGIRHHAYLKDNLKALKVQFSLKDMA